MDGGYIYLDRAIRNHWISSKNEYFSAFIKMLFEVNFKDASPVPIKGRFIDCKRGQSINSLATWVGVLGDGWTIQRVRTFFKLLESDGIINMENLSVTTRLTICKYDTYQNKQHDANMESNTQPTCNQHATNNKRSNVSKESKVKKFTPPSVEDVEKYISERGKIDPSEAERFCDFYASKGWMVGKNKMKDWKAAVRNWEKGNSKTSTSQTSDDVLKGYNQ